MECQLPAITTFDVTPRALQVSRTNTRLVSDLIQKISNNYQKIAHSQHKIHQGVRTSLVKELIEKFSYSEGGGNWEKTTLLKYISDMEQMSELTDWTVALFSRRKIENANFVEIGENKVYPLQRGVDDLDGLSSKIGLKNSALASMSDELLDFSEDEKLNIQKTGRIKKTKVGK